MNLDDTRPTPGKTRVYLQKSRFTRKIPGRVPTNVCRARRHIAFSQGQCATYGAQRLLKYAHRTMCCRYACLKAAAAKRRARHADGSADDAVAMCSASRSWRCLACTSAIPISSLRTIWLDVAEVRSRSSNENRKRRMLRRRLLSMRRIDRPPQAKKIWGLRRIVVR